MKKLAVVLLLALVLCGCVEPEPAQTQPTTIETFEATPVVPSPQEMPTRGGDYQLPPGEDNIPDETHDK